MNLYADIILDLWRNPQNFGEMQNPDFEAYELNPLCGDEVRIQLKLVSSIKPSSRGHSTELNRSPQAEGNHESRIEGAVFTGNGCAISMATASLLTEFAKGKKLNDLTNLAEKDITSLLGIKVGPARIKCAILPLIALKKALASNEKAQSSN